MGLQVGGTDDAAVPFGARSRRNASILKQWWKWFGIRSLFATNSFCALFFA
jgi:hypothetical protein